MQKGARHGANSTSEGFHELSDAQVDSLARYAAACGGVLITSDTLAELRPDSAALLAQLLAGSAEPCQFPQLGAETGPVIEYQIRTAHYLFNLADQPLRLGLSEIALCATGLRP